MSEPKEPAGAWKTPEIDPYRMILAEEEHLAREAALAVLVTRDRPLWRTVIPGMFIFELLARSKMIRRVMRFYMPPREQAAENARQKEKARLPGNAASLPDRGQAQNAMGELMRFGARAGDLLLQLVETLTGHYAALAAAGGYTFSDLVRNAYPDRQALETVEERICRLEAEWNEAAGSARGGPPMPASCLQELARRRRKRAEQIF